jgi:hypothetical protein|tara:strand:+ start:1666 stop:2112 length:447 start_codon:yes stop_codon:yes gene_type:complete
MQIKKSVVQKCEAAGTWDTKREPIKTFFRFNITMENGDKGEYSSVKADQDKFVEGQEVEYEFQGGDFPKIKPHYENPISTTGGNYNVSPTDGESERIARSVALKCATEFGINQGLELSEVLATAKIMSEFIIKDLVAASTKANDGDPF